MTNKAHKGVEVGDEIELTGLTGALSEFNGKRKIEAVHRANAWSPWYKRLWGWLRREPNPVSSFDIKADPKDEVLRVGPDANKNAGARAIALGNGPKHKKT